MDSERTESYGFSVGKPELASTPSYGYGEVAIVSKRLTSSAYSALFALLLILVVPAALRTMGLPIVGLIASFLFGVFLGNRIFLLFVDFRELSRLRREEFEED